MISLFRKIRQRLLAESKFTRYLIYAIGEIVLVVIGILIALQINNWNQSRHEANKEGRYLVNMKHDLENQLKSIDIQLEYEQKYSDLGTRISDQYFNSNALVIDSAFCATLEILTERKTFVRTDPTFEDMISSGNIGLLKDENLRNALIEYYQELERLEKVVQNNNTLHTDQGFAHKIFDLIYVGNQSTAKRLQISNKLIEDPERELMVINLVERRTHMAKNHIRVMIYLREKTEEILKRLQFVDNGS